MAMNDSDSSPPRWRVFYAPWERAFDRVMTPFEEFIHRQTTSGLLLMICAAIALYLANSRFAESYFHLVHTPIGLSLGEHSLRMSLQHWVNDGLMMVFFFVVGLELKREILVGELAEIRNAILPIIAAIGGMVVPALIYLALNRNGPQAQGWGIPMATDIAFAVGALALLAGRVPKSLITFLVALAIVDDLGAVLVIALFYTKELSVPALAVGALLVGVLVSFNLFGIRRPLPYFLIAILLWMALLKSGVHATLAGVIAAFTIPARPKFDPQVFSELMKQTLARFDAEYRPGHDILTNEAQRGIVQTLENGVLKVQAPLQRLEHQWHTPVAYLVIPVFALINAGVPIDFSSLGGTLGHPVTLGVVAGLVLGKFLGIAGACWLALKLGIGRLPHATCFSQLAGVGLLAGIGFTMSIFISELAFEGQEQNLLMAKTGILLASLVAGFGGYLWLLLASRHET